MSVPGKAALQRRARRRRRWREHELRVANVMEWGYSRAEAILFLADPANETLCPTCGWTMGMVCPECAKGCGCETRCSGWRHQEWNDDDGQDDETDCEGCGAGNEYECVCYQRSADEEDYGPERGEPDDWYDGDDGDDE